MFGHLNNWLTSSQKQRAANQILVVAGLVLLLGQANLTKAEKSGDEGPEVTIEPHLRPGSSASASASSNIIGSGSASASASASAAADGFIGTAEANAIAKMGGESRSDPNLKIYCTIEKRKRCCKMDMRFLADPETFKKERTGCDIVFMRKCCTNFGVGKRDGRALRFVNELIACISEIVDNIFEFNFEFPKKCCDLIIFSYLPACTSKNQISKPAAAEASSE